MINKVSKLRKSNFVRNVFILSSGTAAAQIINLLLSPVITRIYGPEAYGLMGAFLAIISIITPIAALTYPFAIVLPKRDSVAKGIIQLSLVLTLTVTIVIGILLVIFYQPIVRVFQLEDIAPYLYLIPIVILSAGFLQVTEQWLIRTKQFGISAQVTVLQTIIVNGGKVGVGLFHTAALVLIVFSAIKQGLKFILLFLFMQKKKLNRSRDKHNNNEKISLIELAKRYIDFPIFRAPQTLIYGVTQSIPVLLLTSFFGPVSAGFYSLANSVMGAPTQLIGKAVGDVFYPRISEAEIRGENLTNLILKATIYLAFIGIIPFGIVIVFGPWLFSFVFGPDWFSAGQYARWIGLFVLFNLIHQPSVKALPVLSAQRFHLIFTIFTLIVNVVSLAAGYYLFSSDLIAVAFFGVSSSILSVILIIRTLHISKKFKKNNRL